MNTQPVLETERLLLRLFVMEDAGRLSAYFMGTRKCFNTLVVSQAEINLIAGIHRQAPCSFHR